MPDGRKFTAEFKTEAIELVISSVRPVAQTTQGIGADRGALGNQVHHGKKEHLSVLEDDSDSVKSVEY